MEELEFVEGDVDLVGEEDMELGEGGFEEVGVEVFELAEGVEHLGEGGLFEDVVDNVLQDLGHHITYIINAK